MEGWHGKRAERKEVGRPKGEREQGSVKMLIGLRLRVIAESVHLWVIWGSFRERKAERRAAENNSSDGWRTGRRRSSDTASSPF